MWLPNPNEKQVAEFKRICSEELGMELSDEDALDTATRLMHIEFIRRFVYKDPAKGIQGAPEDSPRNLRRRRKHVKRRRKTLRILQ